MHISERDSFMHPDIVSGCMVSEKKLETLVKFRMAYMFYKTANF